MMGIRGVSIGPGPRGGAVVAVLGVLMLTACSSSRLIASPSPPGPPLGLTATGDELGLVLTHVIVPNGPGAWVKDAPWHAYALTVSNRSARPVTVERVRLVDPRGLYIDPGVNPLRLEKTSDTLAQQYRDATMAAAPAVASTTTLVGAGAVIGAVAPPVALVALPVYGVYRVNKSRRTAQDHEELERELTRRQLPSLTLAGNSTVSGSFFFPVVPGPRALAVDYRVGREVKELVLPLAERGGAGPSAPGPAGGSDGGPGGTEGEGVKAAAEGPAAAGAR